MTTPALLRLQETDRAIDRSAARRRALEEGSELAAARERADAAEGSLGELKLKLDELGRDQTTFEHEIDSLTQKEQDEQARMFGGAIVNTKELEALQHEIASVRKRRSDREDELLALLEVREQLEADARAAEREARDQRAAAERAADEASQELTRVVAELAQRTEERGKLALEIDPEVLELYESLRRQKKGIGAAALVDGVCQACHEHLSAVVLDELKRTEGIRRCEYCRRILVM
jgi:hypothetical protein